VTELFAAAIFGISVMCGSTASAHTYTTADGRANRSPVGANAYYVPRVYVGGGFIVVDRRSCADVRSLTRAGRRTLSHELTHWHQDVHGLPFDELDAHEVGFLGARLSKRRWEGIA
jgi:hypothetical protein